MWSRDEGHQYDRSPQHRQTAQGRRTEQWDPWQERQLREDIMGRSMRRDADEMRHAADRRDGRHADHQHWHTPHQEFSERQHRYARDIDVQRDEREFRDHWEGPRRWDGSPLLPAEDRRWDGTPLPSDGEHVGKGPKGWKRSDDRLKDDVSESLARHPDIDASEIEVDCTECEIILTGVVHRRADKRLAEDVAVAVFGVWDVQNGLRIVTEDAWVGPIGSPVRSQQQRQDAIR